MIEQVYKELKYQFKNKVDKSEELFTKFCNDYIIETVNHSDILEIVNSSKRDIDNIKILDYLQNKNILLRAIKVLTLLEVSKDFKGFLKLSKLLKTDRDIDTVEFDKVLLQLLKTKG